MINFSNNICSYNYISSIIGENFITTNISIDYINYNRKDNISIRIFLDKMPEKELLINFCDCIFHYIKTRLMKAIDPLFQTFNFFNDFMCFYTVKDNLYGIIFRAEIKNYFWQKTENCELNKFYLHNIDGPAIEIFDKNMNKIKEFYFFKGKPIPYEYPKVINGKLNCKTCNKEIIDVILNFDREYGLYLFKYFQQQILKKHRFKIIDEFQNNHFNHFLTNSFFDKL